MRLQILSFSLLIIGSSAVGAQTSTPAQAGAASQLAAATANLPPATKLEAFRPAAGSVVTIGSDVLDRMGQGMSVVIQMREMKDQRSSGSVRGLVVEVSEGTVNSERSFVDVDELPELAQAVDALLEITKNPTTYKDFEVRYQTRGELRITAFNSLGRGIRYEVRAGRVLTAAASIDREELGRFRKAITTAQTKFGTE